MTVTARRTGGSSRRGAPRGRRARLPRGGVSQWWCRAPGGCRRRRGSGRAADRAPAVTARRACAGSGSWPCDQAGVRGRRAQRRFGAEPADRVSSQRQVACPSGLRSTPRKRVWVKAHRGFKSHRYRTVMSQDIGDPRTFGSGGLSVSRAGRRPTDARRPPLRGLLVDDLPVRPHHADDPRAGQEPLAVGARLVRDVHRRAEAGAARQVQHRVLLRVQRLARLVDADVRGAGRDVGVGEPPARAGPVGQTARLAGRVPVVPGGQHPMVGSEDHRADPPTGAVGTGGHGSGDAKGPRIPRGTRARVAHHHGGHRRHRSSTVRPYWLNPSRVCSGRPFVVIGRDMRPSGPELVAAFAEGLTGRGVDVELIGLCSTDGLYHASGALGVPGAMFTASHNPARYNGIKMCRSGARPVGQDTGLAAIRDRASQYLATGVPVLAEGRGEVSERVMLGEYADFLRGLVDLSGIRLLKVVVDAGNGMAGLTAPAVPRTAGAVRPAIPLPASTTTLSGRMPDRSTRPRRKSAYSPSMTRSLTSPRPSASTGTPVARYCEARSRIAARPVS